MKSSTKIILIVAASLLSVAIILMSILIPLSFTKVNQGNYGILVNDISKSSNPTIYNAGKYYTGLSGSFVTFPSGVFSLEFLGNNVI